jgi:hypothetical protein
VLVCTGPYSACFSPDFFADAAFSQAKAVYRKLDSPNHHQTFIIKLPYQNPFPVVSEGDLAAFYF